MYCIGSLKKLVIYLPGKHLLTTWLLSIWVHSILLLGVIDINRHELPQIPSSSNLSPKSDNINVKPNIDTPHRRLVVIHIDSLDPIRLFGHIEEQPKLKNIVGNKGSWGLAFSPSFITRRQRLSSTFTGSYWIEGPGLLEKASSVFFIGDPYTESTFKKLGRKLKAFTWDDNSWNNYSYISDDKSADAWVQQQTLSLLRSKSFPEIHHDKVVMIIRLIGIGMSSDLEGEHSLRAKEALTRVLKILNEFVTASEELWNDNQTIYAVVSDLKISPVLTWGPCISSTLLPEPNPSNIDWKSPYTKRRDIDRRSIAPLLACTLNLEPPRESVSALPIDFLQEKPRMKAKCASKTSHQIMRLYVETANYYQKEGYLKIPTFWTSVTPENTRRMAERISQAYDEGDYMGVIAASKVLVDRCIHGLHYYGEFKRKFSSHLLMITVIGWMFACATWICPRLDLVLEMDNENRIKTVWYCRPRVVFDLIMTFLSLSVVMLCALDKMSLRFYAYAVTPCLVWWAGLRDSHYWLKIYKCTVHPDSMSFVSAIYIVFSGVCWSIISDRLSLSFLLVGTLTFSSLFSMLKTKSSRLKIWLLTSIPFIVLLHDNRKESEETTSSHFVSALGWILAICFISKMALAKLGDSPILVGNLLSLIAILLNDASGGRTTPYHAAWLVLIFIPLIGSHNVIMRLVQIFFSLSVPFFLLSTGYEPLSLLGLLFHATTWYLAECHSNSKHSEILQDQLQEGNERIRKFGTNDSRRVFFYTIYIILAMSAVRVTDHFIIYDGDFTAGLTKDTANPAFFWSAKAFVPIACLSSLVVLLWKKTNGDELALALAIMFMCSLMSIMFLFMVLAAGEDLEKLRWTVSHYYAGQFVSVITLLSIPAAYILTIPSLLAIYITSPYLHTYTQ